MSGAALQFLDIAGMNISAFGQLFLRQRFRRSQTSQVSTKGREGFVGIVHLA